MFQSPQSSLEMCMQHFQDLSQFGFIQYLKTVVQMRFLLLLDQCLLVALKSYFGVEKEISLTFFPFILNYMLTIQSVPSNLWTLWASSADMTVRGLANPGFTIHGLSLHPYQQSSDWEEQLEKLNNSSHHSCTRKTATLNRLRYLSRKCLKDKGGAKVPKSTLPWLLAWQIQACEQIQG